MIPPHQLLSRRSALGLLGASALVPLASCRERSTAASGTDGSSNTPVHYASLQDVSRRIAARDVTSLEVTEAMLARIARVDPRLKSYATVMTNSALREARVADQEIHAGRHRGPLHGVPVAVKDLCYTEGVRTMGGTPVLGTFAPVVDATVVARLRDAGAVILGKLNLSEGAMAGYNPALDVPLNPWDAARWPGMSSSGPGVAAAAGLCFAAIGTDTGGSIRFPSSACGVVGLKPTYGRVSRFGVLKLAESFDHVGPMARTVGDVAIMLEAIAGSDMRDTTALSEPAPRAFAEMTESIAGLRIGIDRDYAFRDIDRGQATAIEAALQVLATLGAQIVGVRMPDLTGMIETAWLPVCAHEAAAAHAATYPSRASEYGPYFREVLRMGAAVTPGQLTAARTKCASLAAQFTAVLESVDAMACPAGGDPAWPITHELQVGPLPTYHAAWSAASPRATDFTTPMNIAGTPAICLPCGFSPDGLPYSIQFAGRRLSESLLCRVAHAYQRATPWHGQHPDVDVALA